MDEEDYKKKLEGLRKEVIKVYLRIDNLTADDVTYATKDTYRVDLYETRRLFTVTRERLYELIGELNENVASDKTKSDEVKAIDE